MAPAIQQDAAQMAPVVLALADEGVKMAKPDEADELDYYAKRLCAIAASVPEGAPWADIKADLGAAAAAMLRQAAVLRSVRSEPV